MKKDTHSYFAPGERLTEREAFEQNAKLSEHTCSAYFNFFPLPLVVVNSQRQIVFSNKAFCKVLGVDNLDGFIGMRPGEAMGCTYSDEEVNGCGTSRHCSECGALLAVLESITNNTEEVRECQLLLKQPVGGTNARDLRVQSAPWDTEDGRYYVVTMTDIGDEKRRRVLERLFFHDILNSVGGTRNLAELLSLEITGKGQELAGIIKSSLFGVTEEILSQKELLAVENDEYEASLITLQALEVVESVVDQFSNHLKAQDKDIVVDESSENVAIQSDYSLLRRVLINMLVNALEASSEGQTITLGVRPEGRGAKLWVHNDVVMDERTQLQLFKRSFSTKGKGRGLGTYSIKLLTENYLGGEVGFRSTEDEGTTFWIEF